SFEESRNETNGSIFPRWSRVAATPKQYPATRTRNVPCMIETPRGRGVSKGFNPLADIRDSFSIADGVGTFGGTFLCTAIDSSRLVMRGCKSHLHLNLLPTHHDPRSAFPQFSAVTRD